MKRLEQYCLSSNRVRSRQHFRLRLRLCALGLFAFVVIAYVVWPHHTQIQRKHEHSPVFEKEHWQQLALNLHALDEPIPTKLRQVREVKSASSLKLQQRIQQARLAAPTTLYQRRVGGVAQQNDVMRQRDAASQFVNRRSHVSEVRVQRLLKPDCTVVAGELIHAVLETAINSNLSGMVRAVVTQPVYAYVGDRVLIPAGSRLLGQYQTAQNMSQTRLMVVWSRVILPGGQYVLLDSPGADALGRSGQAASVVDRHFWQRFGQASLLSMIGASSAVVGVADQQQYNSLSQYRSQLAQGFQQSAQQSLAHSIALRPTLSVHQGAAINVFVVRDLIFDRVQHSDHWGVV